MCVDDREMVAEEEAARIILRSLPSDAVVEESNGQRFISSSHLDELVRFAKRLKRQ